MDVSNAAIDLPMYECSQLAGGRMIEVPQHHKTLGSEKTDPAVLGPTLLWKIRPHMGDDILNCPVGLH